MSAEQSTRPGRTNPFWWRALARILAFVVGWNLYWRLVSLVPGHPLDGETAREITIAVIVHGIIGGFCLSAAVFVYKLLYGRLTREGAVERSQAEATSDSARGAASEASDT